jgi:DNA-binding NtrC family response regulator
MIYLYSQQKEYLHPLQLGLTSSGFESRIFDDSQMLVSAFKGKIPEAILLDLRFDDYPPKYLEKVFLENPSVIVLGLVGANSGQFQEYVDQLLESVDSPDIIASVLNEHLADRKLLNDFGLVGRSNELIGVARMIEQVGSTDINVLITGPSGSGKEMVARAIHHRSGKSDDKFVAINIGSLAPGVIESELFGHEKGSFTGAVGRRLGHFEMAAGGTLFIDEIGELPADLQVKLLRVLEDKSFYRVGAQRKTATDARLIFATNRNLAEEVAAGRFREDLYYRLNVVNIVIPSLAARPRDIPPLVKYFIDKSRYTAGTNHGHIESGALKLMLKYHWPGNVRELKNVIESLLVLSEKGIITQESFEKYLRQKALHDQTLPVPTGRTPESAEHQLIIQAILSLKDEITALRRHIEENGGTGMANYKRLPEQRNSLNLDDNEKQLIIQTLSEVNGNRKRAAAILGIGERTLYRKLEKYGLK